MQRVEIANWLDHPVTQEFLKVLTEDQQIMEESISNLVLNSPLKKDDLIQVRRFQGGVFVLKQLINRDILISRLSSPEEVENES